MPSRDAALDALNTRLAAATSDPGLLLTDDSLREAAELAAATDTATDLPAAQALGWFHWNRLSQSDRVDHNDVDAVIRYFIPVYECSPGSVPTFIQQVIRDYEQASASLGTDPAVASDRASRLIRAYQSNGELPDLVNAIALLRDLVAVTPRNHPHHVVYLSDLGVTLQLLFERTGDIEALTEAIKVAREALAATPLDHPEYAASLRNLGIDLRVLFERTGDVEALTEAIRVAREALAAAPLDHPEYAASLNILGAALALLFERTGEIGTLTEAVQAGRDAVAATPQGHPEYASRLNNLGISLRLLFKRTGDAGALTEAVKAGQDAVAATPQGHRHLAALLINLGVALALLFERTRDIEALTEAIKVAREALAATPLDHPEYASPLRNLGIALQLLFEHTGDTGALTEAVQAGREAVAATPQGHPERAAQLSNLGAALLLLFERTRDIEALTEAIKVAREALAATALDHPEYASRLSNLGSSLRRLSERTGDEGALTEAVQAGRDAVAATPQGHPERAMNLSSLVGPLALLFERTRDEGALTEAVQAGRDAVAATPQGHPEYASRLNNLGNSLRRLSEHTGHTGTLREAAGCFQAAGVSPAAGVGDRIKGWRNAAAILPDTGVSDDALVAAEAVVELLPQITPRWLARADREYQLGEVGALAGVVAAAAVAAGRPERAAELLEQTRGVLVAETVDARSSDLIRLRETAPELAQAFEELRARLDALDRPSAIPRGMAGPDTYQDLDQARREARYLADARREAQADWDQLITRIRGIGGFAGFLTAPSMSKLAAQAKDGPIVFVYTSPARCDALILTRDPHTPVRLVPLTALTDTAAVEQVMRLLETPSSCMSAQGDVLDVLAWVWDTITEPVLKALGYTATPNHEESWPRVWWCPVGVTAYLPLHAAGHHRDLDAEDPDLKANPRTVLDRVISSYTTTVRSLAYARAHHLGTDKSKAVIVAVPDAPGTPLLSGVAAETKTLRRLLPGALVLASPTRDTVLAALPDHQVAHFACHGSADWNDPASSRLILRDHQTAPLTVADVSALRIHGDLAYLSACDTNVTSPRLADEAVHITGAFHLAGYQHVIGTLWPISDAAAGDITKDFYDNITADGKTPPQTSRSAQALHHAIRCLRARCSQAPMLWAAHTHTGP
jgi:tetratricopeptide (TPR) repeat protein